VLGYHFSEVLWERIDLLLEEEKGCTDGTQLSLIKDKGEFLHVGVSASKLVLSGYGNVRQKEGGYSVYERKGTDQ
jgi:hypothetical protein